MKVHYDAYNVICCGHDPDEGISDSPNIVPVGIYKVDEADFPLIDVSDEEYKEFLACKVRLTELQDIFSDRVPDK